MIKMEIRDDVKSTSSHAGEIMHNIWDEIKLISTGAIVLGLVALVGFAGFQRSQWH